MTHVQEWYYRAHCIPSRQLRPLRMSNTKFSTGIAVDWLSCAVDVKTPHMMSPAASAAVTAAAGPHLAGAAQSPPTLADRVRSPR